MRELLWAPTGVHTEAHTQKLISGRKPNRSLIGPGLWIIRSVTLPVEAILFQCRTFPIYFCKEGTLIFYAGIVLQC